MGIETTPVDVHDEGALVVLPVVHDDVFRESALVLGRTADHGVDRALVGAGILRIAAALGTPRARILGVSALLVGRGKTVVSVDEHGTFVGVAVAGEIQVRTVVLEGRHESLAHLDQLEFGVGVVRTLGVGRMVPVGDDEVLRGRRQVFAHPVVHRAPGAVVGTDVGGGIGGCGAVRIVGVERHEVDIRVVVGVVGLGSAGDTAGLGRRWQGERVVVRTGLRRRVRVAELVVTRHRPQDVVAQHLGEGLEQTAGVLAVGAVVVGVVAEHQDDVGLVAAVLRDPIQVLVHDGHRVVAAGGVDGALSRVTDHPDPHRNPGALRRRGLEVVVGVIAGERGLGVADLVVVLGGAVEAGDLDLVLIGQLVHLDDSAEAPHRRSEGQLRIGEAVGSPADDHRVRRSHLEVRSSYDFGRFGLEDLGQLEVETQVGTRGVDLVNLDRQHVVAGDERIV